jgi:diguanylate cyclase (GGDEF)-like protein
MREMLAVTGAIKGAGSARTCCCSPTAGSPAGPPACASGTSRPRRSTAARSRGRATATASGSTSPNRTLDLLVDDAELERRREALGRRCRRATPGACWPSTPSWSGSASRGAVCDFPGTGRSARGWLLLGLDGWLVGGSLFILIWVFAVPATQLAADADGVLGSSLWVLPDLALASVVIALTRRVEPGSRDGGVLLSITAILMCNGDLYRTMFSSDGWGDTGQAAFLGSWTAAAVIAGVTPWISPSPFVRMSPAADRRPLRWPYAVASAAIGVAVLAWTFGRPPDPLLATVVVTLLVSVVVSQGVLGAENARLMARVSEQADLFRDRAARDLLTGLPNRGEFTGRVERALIGPARGSVAVLFVDLDGFKDVNDSFGHAVGDELLVEAAGRLSREVRERDVVARFGGDEFVAMLTDCTDEMALEVAERLRHELSRPYRVAGREVVVSASIGLSRPGAADDAESALRNADLALYRAKSSGRDRVAVYEPRMHEHVLRRLDGAARLRRALAEDRLRLAYQPIVDLRTGAILGMEALLRFDTQDLPGWGVADAVEAAEESGLIVPIGRWVLDAAVRQSAEWLSLGHEMRVAVNVSARQLEAGDLVDGVEAALARHGLPACPEPRPLARGAGVDTVFGIPGGAILPAYDPLMDSTQVRTSSSATSRAPARGRGLRVRDRRVGVCMATSGPGRPTW